MVRLSLSLARVPVIKFRKGGLQSSGAIPSAAGSPKAAPASGPAVVKKRAATTAAIEDFMLPKRFQRQPISQEEIEFINTGGAMALSVGAKQKPVVQEVLSPARPYERESLSQEEIDSINQGGAR